MFDTVRLASSWEAWQKLRYTCQDMSRYVGLLHMDVKGSLYFKNVKNVLRDTVLYEWKTKLFF